MRGRKSQARQRLCDNREQSNRPATNLTVSRSRHGHREETPRFFSDPASIPPELSVSLLNTPRLFNATFSHGSPLHDHELTGQVNSTVGPLTENHGHLSRGPALTPLFRIPAASSSANCVGVEGRIEFGWARGVERGLPVSQQADHQMSFVRA